MPSASTDSIDEYKKRIMHKYCHWHYCLKKSGKGCNYVCHEKKNFHNHDSKCYARISSDHKGSGHSQKAA
jgi:hypothetical protein